MWQVGKGGENRGGKSGKRNDEKAARGIRVTSQSFNKELGPRTGWKQTHNNPQVFLSFSRSMFSVSTDHLFL